LVRALGVPLRDPGKGASTMHIRRAHQRLLGGLGRDLARHPRPTARSPPRHCKARKNSARLVLVRSAQRTADLAARALSPDAWQVITEMAESLASEVDVMTASSAPLN